MGGQDIVRLHTKMGGREVFNRYRQVSVWLYIAIPPERDAVVRATVTVCGDPWRVLLA